jgi:hypothetical protein
LLDCFTLAAVAAAATRPNAIEELPYGKALIVDDRTVWRSPD